MKSSVAAIAFSALGFAQAQTPATPTAGAPRAPSASLAPPPDAPPPKPQPPGPYAVSVISEPTLSSHTVYRPADMASLTGDKRIDTVVVWNSGVFNAGSTPGGAAMSDATKDMIAKFHAPVAYFPGGPADLAYANSKDDFSRVTTVPAFFGSLNVGHGGTYRHPGGGWAGEVGVAWLDWHLKGSKEAAKYFEGADCTLCKNPIWEVSKKNMK